MILRSSVTLSLVILISTSQLSGGEGWNFFRNLFIRCTSKSTPPSASMTKASDRPKIRCYGELGCLANTNEWFHILYRPINLLPQEREEVKTRFYLFYRNRTINPPQVYTNRGHLLAQGFDPNKPIKVITHGYIDTANSTWVIKLAQALLTAADLNIFVIDWAGGSSFYPQAAANTRLVALEIIHYAKFLQKEFGGQVQPANVHCIGHSLGSHICAYVGNGIPGLGRITGLDPAEPLFQYMPETVRLSPDDAKLVDVIHSDGETILLLGYGMMQPCGHMDFYPNDGKDQPGCELAEKHKSVLQTDNMDEATRELFACDHHRAIHYFTESILSKCQFIGHICPDYATYLRGDCATCGSDGSNCAPMGLAADTYDVGNRSLLTFFVSTGKAPPFCVHHYRVGIQFERPKEAPDGAFLRGKLKLSISGNQAAINKIEIPLTDNLKIENGANLTFLVQTSIELGDIQWVRVDWKSDVGYLNVMSTCWPGPCDNDRMYVKSIEVMDIDKVTTDTKNNLARNGDIIIGASKEKTTWTLCGDCSGTRKMGIASGSFELFNEGC